MPMNATPAQNIGKLILYIPYAAIKLPKHPDIEPITSGAVLPNRRIRMESIFVEIRVVSTCIAKGRVDNSLIGVSCAPTRDAKEMPVNVHSQNIDWAKNSMGIFLCIIFSMVCAYILMG